MCTVILAHRTLPGWPVFLAANRDEFFARESEPPRVESSPRGVRILAPRDRRAGGTWIGLNDRGLVVVITNRSDLPTAPPPGARSRGLLVQGVLEAATIDEARGFVEADAREPSAPYNLLFGDRDAWYLSERDSTEPARVRRLEPGVTVVSNFGVANDPAIGEVTLVGRLWRERIGDGDPFAVAQGILSIHEAVDGLPPPCKVGHPDRGTRSSSLIGIDGAGQARYLHADGPPHRTPYREIETP